MRTSSSLAKYRNKGPTTASAIVTIPKTAPAEPESMETKRPTAIKKLAAQSPATSQNATTNFRPMGTGAKQRNTKS
jgi:hypothetical protein